MRQPCDNLRVVDFTQGMAGNLAAMVLSDYGAEVVKVEPPTGDPWRDQPGWTFWNRGKRTLRLDLKSEPDCDRLRPLLMGTDVIIESFRPGVAERLGIGYEAVSADNPTVVYCSLTGFGRQGPFAHLKGYEGIVNAKTGRMREFSGIADRDGPGYPAVATASYGACHGALQGILAALYRRRRTGLGARVDTSLLQGNTAFDMIRWFAIQRSETNALAKDRATTWGAIEKQVPRPNYLTAVTKDGVWLQFANTMPHLFMAQMNALGLTHVYENPRWANLPAIEDPADSEGVWQVVLERVREKTWAEWKQIFDAEPNMNAEPFLSTREAFDHIQVRHNGHVVTVAGTEQPGPLVAMPGAPETFAAPVALDDTDALAARWKPRPSHSTETGSADAPPLEGLLIVDFASYYATPFGSALLADYGARVIKVEPLEGEYSRYVAGRLLAFKTTAGKESLAIDLKRPEAQPVVERLLKEADIVLHNFRPGASERLGINFERVRAVNPRIVYHYGASYGPDGPYAGKPAFHPTAGAIAGGALRQMPPEAVSSADPGLPIDRLKRLAWRFLQANEGNPDVNAALTVGTALLLGIQARDTSGEGQAQHTTMICANLYANGDDAIRYAGCSPAPALDINLLGTGPLDRLYKTSDGWVYLCCPFESEWVALSRALGEPGWLDDQRFGTPAARRQHAVDLAAHLERAFSLKSTSDWEHLLVAADVACTRADGPNVAEFAVHEPSNLEQAFTVEVRHPVHGAYFRHGPIMRIEGTRSTPGPMCEVGEHTRAILQELGFSIAEIEDLEAKRVIASADG